MKKLLMAVLLLLGVTNAWGWEDTVTHPTITEFAAHRYFDPIDTDFLGSEFKSDGATKTAQEWLRLGAKMEDQGTRIGFVTGSARSLNHFHAPTKPLDQAGLSDLPIGFSTKLSAVLWAQDPVAQSGADGGDWTWGKVRDHFYNYLMAASKADEEANLAKVLKGLGYQMHLIQDMSQPNHVRNDTHISDGGGNRAKNGFESWAKSKDTLIRQILAEAANVPPTVDLTKPFVDATRAPVARLFDTRENRNISNPEVPFIIPSKSYSQGLAEYTNTNFFSEDTVFAAEGYSTGNKQYFSYPNKNETDLQEFIDLNMEPVPTTDVNGRNYLTYRIKKLENRTTGEKLECIAMPGSNTLKFFQDFGGDTSGMFYRSFVYDEKCFEEHAKLLIPRAAGYSAAMLDHFFRGDLAVSVQQDVPPTSKRISLNVRNTTPTGETMDAGSIDLMVIFRPYKKLDSAAPAGTLVPDGDYQFRQYKLDGCTRDTPVCSIDTTDKPLDFYRLGDPIPPLARDISLIVIYRGKLGKEQDAVAFSETYLDSLAGDLDLSLPARGVYASVADESTSSTFTDFALAAQNTPPQSSLPGSTELLVIYRDALADPFQSEPVDSSAEIKYVSATIPAPQGISNMAKSELTYSLGGAGLPVMATDVYAYLIHTDNSGVVTSGYRDISEPTPVDVFNNADNICINNQWYTAGSPEAIALADSNGNGYPDLFDPYAHNIANIFGKASSTANATLASAADYTFQSPPVLSGGDPLRLGYILTDYSFSYSFKEDWLDADPEHDPWTSFDPAQRYPGTAVKNQTDADGSYTYPGMYNMRGYPMWWGTGLVWDNEKYPTDPSNDCSWSALP